MKSGTLPIRAAICGVAFLACFFAESTQAGTPFPNRILSFEFSSQFEHPYANPVRRSIEFILNDLGLSVEYWDLDRKLFTIADANQLRHQGVLGLVTCFLQEDQKTAKKVIDAIKSYERSELPWASLCGLGFTNELEKQSLAFQKAFWLPWGMSPQPLLSGWPKPVVKQPEYFQFERKAIESMADVLPLRTIGHHQHVLASVQTQGKNSERVQAVIGKRLSIAHMGFGLSISSGTEQRSWNIDPYLFFSNAFQLDRSRPIPDASVINGNRVFFVHVDADGFHASTRNRFGFAGTKMCGEVLGTQIAPEFSNVPIGASIILSEVLDEADGNSDTETVAKNLFKLPNIEPALHSYRHPLVWKIEGYPALKPTASFGPLDEALESEKALQIFEQRFLIPSGKSQKVYYWSGNCMPPEGVLKKIEAAGYLNINGGDSRWDDHFNSMAFLSPVGRRLGDAFQVFTGSSNDNIYTDSWRIPISAFSEVQKTLDQTEGKKQGRIALKPIDLYFHTFALERLEGVNLIRKLITENYSRKVSPVFPSTYVIAAKAVNSAISKKDAGAWVFENIQGLRTLRALGEFWPDLDWHRSSGIIGAKRHGRWVYFHLAPGISSAQLIAKKSTNTIPEIPLLIQLEGQLREWTLDRSNRKLIVVADEWSKNSMTLSLPKAPQVSDSKGFQLKSAWDSKSGLIEFSISKSATPKRLELSW